MAGVVDEIRKRAEEDSTESAGWRRGMRDAALMIEIDSMHKATPKLMALLTVVEAAAVAHDDGFHDDDEAQIEPCSKCWSVVMPKVFESAKAARAEVPVEVIG